MYIKKWDFIALFDFFKAEFEINSKSSKSFINETNHPKKKYGHETIIFNNTFLKTLSIIKFISDLDKSFKK